MNVCREKAVPDFCVEGEVCMRHFLHLILAVMIGSASADRVAAQGPFREAVAVPVDSQTVRAIETAREHAAQRQWAEAIPILQQLIDSREPSLIAMEPGRYLSSVEYCHLLISLFPPEGLDAYRDQMDSRFRERYDRARRSFDEVQIEALLRSGFNCSFADQALLLLADLKFDRGEFAGARECLELLVPPAPLRSPPDAPRPDESADRPLLPFLTCRDVETPRELIYARLILCSLFEGHVGRANRELEAFTDLYPKATGRIAAQEGRLVDLLQDELHRAGETVVPAGESAARKPVRPVRVLWRRPIPRSLYRGPRVRPLLARELPLSLYPQVADGHVFVSTSESVYAFDLNTGRPAWPADSSDSAMIYSTGFDGDARLHLPDTGVPAFVPSISHGRLLARLGAPFLRRSSQETNAVSEIVALDIRNGEGRLALRITSDRIDPGAQSPEATTWSFEGAPLESDGRLFALLRQGSPEDRTVVACFDAATGRLNWQTRVVASLSNLPDHFNLLGTNLLTLDNGRLFLSTGTGAIAAVEAGTGRVLWVVTYESDPVDDLEAYSDPRRTGLSPCLCESGMVFAAPVDADLLLALEASTGRLVWSRRIADRSARLVGVRRGRLILAGESLQALDILTGQPAWSGRIALSGPTGQTYGRPVIAGGEILWPRFDELLYVSLENGTVTDRLNLRHRFGMSAGNLSIADGKLIIAQPEAVAVLSEETLSSGPDAEERPPAVPDAVAVQ